MPSDKKKIVFYSKGAEHRVVRSPVNKVLTASGGQMDANPDPLAYDFAPDGRVEVYEGQDVRPDGPGGAKQDAAEFLRSREGFNVLYWQEGAEPDRPLPTPQDFAQQVTQATLEMDEERLEGLLEQEVGSHGREPLVAQARTALEQVRDTRAAQELALSQQSPLKQEPASA